MNYSYKLCSDGSRAESTKELNFPLSRKDIRGGGRGIGREKKGEEGGKKEKGKRKRLRV